MRRYEGVCDQISNGKSDFKRLDVVQLVKHAFGLRTEAQRRGKLPCLVYLYAEPATWSDGRAVDSIKIKQHQAEVVTFAEAIDGDEVGFVPMSYRMLLDHLVSEGGKDVCMHANAVWQHFAP